MGSDTQSRGRFQARRVALWAVVTSVAVLAGGWMTNARHVLHALLYGVGTVAFLPFLIVVGAIAFALFLGILVGLTGGDVGVVEQNLAGDAAEGGIRLIRPYYRFLGRQRHPWLLGSIVGLLLGGFGLWLLIAVLIAPKEAETATLMARIQSDLEASYSPDHGFVTDVDGKLMQSALDSSAARSAIADSFGRDFVYHSEHSGGTSTYRLRSLGYDGVPSDDDLCVSGETSRARRLIHRVGSAAATLVETVTGETPSWGDQLARVRDIRCVDSG